ncbi:MAG: glutamate--tRNA ligase [bacterium]|nr:glutamate--tRNA ligase [bacterium]
MTDPVRTRFAPSPTGYLHIGGARTALFNYLYAKATGGQFIVRVEDTDQERSSAESEVLILDSMKWLGINEDEGVLAGGPYTPYRQSERLTTYNGYVERLVKAKQAYPCFCTDAELGAKQEKSKALGLPHVYDGKCRGLSEEEVAERKAAGEQFAIRFRVESREIVVEDAVQGRVKFDSRLIGDFIIVKSNGFPSYNFAVVIDDAEMKINHVVRGVGHLSNTPRQILIHEALDLPLPAYSHISEIVGSDKKKLSKRRGAASVLFFRELGYLPEAVSNYMALLGWYPKDGVEYMPGDDLAKKFDVAQCSKAPAMFDFFLIDKGRKDKGNNKNAKGGKGGKNQQKQPDEKNDAGADAAEPEDFDPTKLSRQELEKFINKKSKLNWLNNKYIRDLPIERLWPELLVFLEKDAQIKKLLDSGENESKIKQTFESVKVYLDTLDEFPAYVRELFRESIEVESDEARALIGDDLAKQAVTAFRDLCLEKKPTEAEEYSALMKAAGEQTGAKGRGLFMPIRIAVTGTMQGLELPTLFALLGYEAVARRIDSVLALA